MSVGLLPVGNDAPYVDSNGDPLSGGLMYFYLAGSSTPADTYTTSAGSVANANPVVLNSSGYPASGGNVVQIYGTDGITYKCILKNAAGTTIWTRDNLDVINDANVSVDQWLSGPAPTYISATSFSLVGDQTTDFHVGRRLKTTNSGGTVYSTITASVYAAATTVTVVNDSGTLDAGLSAVYYGLLSATNPSTPLLADTYPIVSGSADKTKKLRIEVDGFTTATTRVLTLPDADLTLPAAVAAGDFVQATSAGVYGRTAIGTAGQIPRVNSGATAQAFSDQIILNSSVATTSGTAVTISSTIPSWAKRLTLNISGVSSSGTAAVKVQLGTGGSATTSGYVGSAWSCVSAASPLITNPSDGFHIVADSAGTYTRYGTVVFTKLTGNTWIASGNGGQEDTARWWGCGGEIALAGALDFMRITADGVDTFDAGAVSLMWE